MYTCGWLLHIDARIKHIVKPNSAIFHLMSKNPLLGVLFLFMVLIFALPLDVGADYLYRSPRPDAQYVSPETQIVIRYATATNINTIRSRLRVVGSQSGSHDGELRLATDGETLVFIPAQPFALGEEVTVAGLGEKYSFEISAERPSLLPAYPIAPVIPTDGVRQLITPTYQTVPAIVPTINVTINDNPTDGYLFTANFNVDWANFSFADSNPHLLIFDNDGDLVYYQNTPQLRFDFKKHPNGLLSSFVNDAGHFEVMNDQYEVIDTYTAIGYSTDNHEFLMQPNGNVILMIYDAQIVDMSQIVDGGQPDAIVIGLVLQEIDPDRNVVFEWRSWDHIPVTDTRRDLTADRIDYIHGNSIEVDNDGNWLVSSRFVDEVTKINRATGDVMWRMGGKANEFTFIPDDGEPFSDQHDARRAPNGNLTVFDNRSVIPSTYARVVEYEVDEANKIAYRIWEHREEGGPSRAMGNAQRLTNGNTLIGWGSMYPSISEVSADGDIVWQMEFERYSSPDIIRNSYRAFRFDWAGYPQTLPALVTRSDDEQTTLYFSWNGATEVAYYRVYSGDSGSDLALKAVILKDGFETSRSFSTAAGCFYQVEPVGKDGTVYQRSPLVIAEGCQSAELWFPIVSHK